MRLNKHFLRSDTPHAFLSASNHAWVRYDDDKLIEKLMTQKATERGTKLHKMAAMQIEEGIRAEDIPQTYNMYVNDSIGHRMSPEVILMVNEFAFGTADALSFRDNYLRIFDLKTGLTPSSMEQLLIYAAFFCLEYGMNPFDLKIELRIYQNNDIRVEMADPGDVMHIIAKINWASKLINQVMEEEQS